MSSTASVASVVLEPDAQAFVEANARPPFLSDLGPVEGRKLVDRVQSGDGVEKPAADVQDVAIPGGPSGQVSVRILRPPGATGQLPVILYLHGGGWVFGNKHTHDRLIRELVAGTGAALVFVNFTPSPEARYPVANEESYAVLKWIAEHGAQQRLDGSRIAVAGDSAGGNMAAALTLMAKQRSGPRIATQVLTYPVTDASFDTPSYDQFAEGYFLRADVMRWFWDQYTTDPSQRDEITASPLRASVDQLAGLPNALVITDEADVLRDEGEAYARKLRQAGVDVTATRYEGITHDFMMLNPLAHANATRDAIAQSVKHLSEALDSKAMM